MLIKIQKGESFGSPFPYIQLLFFNPIKNSFSLYKVKFNAKIKHF